MSAHSLLAAARVEAAAIALPTRPAAAITTALLVAQRALQSAGPSLAVVERAVQDAGRHLEDALDVADAPEALWRAWGEHDLLALLDRLATALTLAVREQRQRDVELLDALLFDDLSAGCAAIGWFTLPRALPGVTAFDPHEHKAVDRIVDDTRAGVVVELLRPGRRALRGALLEPAHVVVATAGGA